MEGTALKINPKDVALVPLAHWPLDHIVSECANHLAGKAAQAKNGHFTLYMRVRTDHIKQDMRDEFARQHPVDPQWHDGISRLLDLIIDSISRLAGQTEARFIDVAVTLGRELPAPVADHPLALSASLDCRDPRRGILHRPAPAAVIPFGLTFTCEPVEIGFRRLNDAQGQGEKLSQNDAALYQWTLRALRMLREIEELSLRREALDGEKIIALCKEMEVYLNILCCEPILQRIARLHVASLPVNDDTESKVRLVHAVTSGVGGSAQMGNYTHPDPNHGHRFAKPYRHMDAAFKDGEHEAALEMLSGPKPHLPMAAVHHLAVPAPEPEKD